MRFDGMNDFLANGFILQAVPALIGAFIGAPVLARELETGTFRYAWTQGFGRWRWALAKLVGLALVVVAATAALSVLFSWYYQPYFATRNQALFLSEASPFANGLFDLRGVSFAAWTLVAFAIGGLAGMLIRRVVPAIVVALAAYAGLAVATGSYLRHHYLAPLVTSNVNVSPSAWITSQWWTKGGAFAFAGRPPLNLLQRFCPPPQQRFGKSFENIAQCLTQHGYTQWTAYQPTSRFWSFQWIEGGWLLALSVLLIAVTVGLVRWRAA
jgi:ABC-type transport system involved in multi-copper enzyme maturation permease subunit